MQPPAVVPRLDDLRVEPQAAAACVADELHLLDVEAELVEPAQPVVDAVGLVRPEHVLARQLRPQRLVAAQHLRRRLERIEARGQAHLGRLEVEQLAGDVLLGDLQVVRALPVAQLRDAARPSRRPRGRPRACPRRGGRACSRASSRPRRTRQVDPHEQLRERVQQAVAQIGHAGPAEQAAVGQREVEVPGDQHRLRLVPVLAGTARHDADRLDDRHDRVGQLAQQPVLVPRDARRQRLERVQRLAVADEAHDVAVDAARDLDEALALPLGQRLAPGQVEEVGIARAHEHLEARRLAHATLPSRPGSPIPAMTWTLAVPGGAVERMLGVRHARLPRRRAIHPGETRHDPAIRAVHDRAAACPTVSSRSTGSRATSPGPGTRRSPACSREVDPEGLAAAAGNPVAMLAAAAPARLEELAGDAGFRERLAHADARLDERLSAQSWYETLPDAPAAIAYFSPEFGLSEALPQYSGGLGILAGDHLKAASDLGVPIVGIGLFYRNGYFRQLLTARGAQQEQFVELDPALLPLTPVLAADGAPLQIAVPLPGATLHAALWRVDVGRVPLLLLDSDVPDNAPAERAVTDRLYGGDSEHRLRQEILLGIGGVKALAACGIEPAVFHMNEGHAGFLAHRARARARRGRRRSRARAAGSCARAPCSRRTRPCPPASTASRTS